MDSGSVRIFHSLIYLFCCLFLLGCDAPRKNPYDPASSNYIGSNAPVSTIFGTVQTRNFEPIQDAFVFIPGVAAVSSNEFGEYQITNLPAKDDYQVICSQDGFLSDTALVSIGFLDSKRQNFELNALPEFINFDVTTRLVYNEPFSPLIYHELNATTMVYDPDGSVDIDTVLFTTTDSLILFGFKEAEVENDTAIFTLTVREADLPVEDFYDMIDEEYYCHVYDKSGAENTSPIRLITRIFDTYPQPEFPTGGIPFLEDTLYVVWDNYEESFDFSFSVYLYYGSVSESFWDSTGIDRTDSSIVYDGEDLDPASYYWRVEAIDNYGNSALSNKAYFEIQEP